MPGAVAKLIEKIASGAWVLFTGAWVSGSARLPTRPQLVERIEADLGLDRGAIDASEGAV